MLSPPAVRYLLEGVSRIEGPKFVRTLPLGEWLVAEVELVETVDGFQPLDEFDEDN